VPGISLVEALDHTVTIRWEGRVRGPSADEPRRSCKQSLAKGVALYLELAGVSFIDLEGVLLGRWLRDRSAGILHCSPFVAEQLKG
jgi:hypothetical protein